MIKFVQCVRRHPDLDPAEFRGRWHEYLDAFKRLAQASDAARLTSGHSLVHDQNALIQSERGTAEPFDAMLEVWWRSGADAMKRLSQPELETEVLALRKVQAELIDVEGSSFFFIDEEVLIED